MLSQFDSIPSDHYHCSPLLTRPKDGNKRRVILDLSYLDGQSVNDRVDKLKFDGSDFMLKFPPIDDIADRINDVKVEVRLFEVDVAHAFRNLRVDPADDPPDTLKLGIKWKGN